jgi:hypothetical protein
MRRSKAVSAREVRDIFEVKWNRVLEGECQDGRERSRCYNGDREKDDASVPEGFGDSRGNGAEGDKEPGPE